MDEDTFDHFSHDYFERDLDDDYYDGQPSEHDEWHDFDPDC